MHTADKTKVQTSDIIVIFLILGLAILSLTIFGWIIFSHTGSKK
jgi:hypothetical protein